MSLTTLVHLLLKWRCQSRAQSFPTRNVRLLAEWPILNQEYSTKAKRLTISTTLNDISAPHASVSLIGLPGRKFTGCCRPSSMAILVSARKPRVFPEIEPNPVDSGFTGPWPGPRGLSLTHT